MYPMMHVVFGYGHLSTALSRLVAAAAVVLFAPVALANPLWLQRGENINASGIESFGRSVAVSADGSTLVAGSTNNDEAGQNAGQVRVFRWNGVQWVQRGQNLNGRDPGDAFGFSVAISADGSTIVAGATSSQGVFNFEGQDFPIDRVGEVRVYRWNSSTLQWDQLGQILEGEVAQSNNGNVIGRVFGNSVSVNGDGSLIAVGAPGNPELDLDGQVEVFAFDVTTGKWVQQGSTLTGGLDADTTGDAFGDSVAVSGDGLALVVGAPTTSIGANLRFSGQVQTFVWNATLGEWEARGLPIGGSASFEVFGDSTAISADGLTIAAAADSNDELADNAGEVRVFDWNGSQWVQRGSDINGDLEGQRLGSSLALSADGRTLVAGSAFSTSLTDAGILANSGRVQVFVWNGSAWVQRGVNLNGIESGAFFGSAVAVNADGLTIVANALGEDIVGTTSGSGVVRVYDWVTLPEVEHDALAQVTAGNVEAYPVSGSCGPIGSTVSVKATDGALTTPEMVASCLDSGVGTGAFSTSLDLSALAMGTVTVESSVSNEGFTETDSDTVDKTVAATCNGLQVTIFWAPGAVATNGDDVILGTDDADRINAFGGNDTVCGLGGNDTINGGNGVDVILGGEGNDTIGGQGGNDELRGEAGADRLNGGPGNDELFGGEGEDDLRGQGDDDTLDGGAGVDQFFGGSGDDIIITGSGGNLGTGKLVRGQGNNDTITGSGEADDLEGGPGMDEISGGDGDDLLRGGNGADRLLGESGADTLEGGASNDDLFGGTGDDILRGGIGDDDLFGEGGDDELNGQGGTDDCDGGSTDETLGDSATTTCETTSSIEL